MAEITPLITFANIIAFADAILFFLIAKTGIDILSRLSGRKIPQTQRLYFIGAAGLFFLYKLSYLLFSIYGIDSAGLGAFLPNVMLFFSGLLMLKGSHKMIECARGYGG